MGNKATIHRDKNGIPHIEAHDRPTLYRAQGYVHAKDRGMQLLLMRILGQGRLSEYLDSSEESLAIDTFFRQMNWGRIKESSLAEMSAETKTYLASYTDGVNEALAEGIPWEFKLMGYKPGPWRMDDSLMMSRMIGYLTLAQSQAEIERFIVEMIQAGIDRDRLEALFPGQLTGLDMDLVKKVTLGERIVPPEVLWNLAAPRMMASNNWVVSGKMTASGSPIMSNDPHLETNRLPNVWCEMVLKVKDRWAIGGTMPGFPGLLSGRTDRLAFAVTYAFIDATDSWIEQCREGKYLREGEWLPFTERKETILRKKKPPVDITFYENPHGVLDGNPHKEGYYLATRWAAGDSGPRSLDRILSIWDMADTRSAMDAVGPIETGWSFLLADTAGDIGFQMSGLAPIRPKGVSGLVPLPGWEAENDWQGMVDHRDMPRVFNPERGFFVTTNQDLNEFGTAKPINMPMGPYRADRIATLLENRENLTVADMSRIQFDLYSTQAKAFMEILKPLLPDTPNGDTLKTWDLVYDNTSEGPFLFEAFYAALYRTVFGTFGIGADITDYLAAETGLFIDFYLAFDRVLLSETSPWFGDGTREQVYRKAAQSALEITPQPWGAQRKFSMAHILFGGKLPKFLGFDRGPIPGRGGRATVHQGQIYKSAGRVTTFFPSFRIISDLSQNCCHTNLAGGPSDRRFSKWYTSDLENWLNKKYKVVAPDPGSGATPFK